MKLGESGGPPDDQHGANPRDAEVAG